MKSNIVPFWVWNKRESRMTMTPGRVASGKVAFATRILRSLCGIAMYRKGEKKRRKLMREDRAAAVYEQKFGHHTNF
jgi:uncharacterized protein YhbP (UPF0306 family)